MFQHAHVGEAIPIANRIRFLKDLWWLPGSSRTCVSWTYRHVPHTSGGGDCVPNSMALAGEFSPIFVGRGETVIGLAPNGNKTVMLTLTNGSTQSARVSHNTYVAHTRQGFKTVTLRDSTGTLRTVGDPDGRPIKKTASGAAIRPVQGHAGGAPAINLPPGVVTVARLRQPDGTPFSLTLQRIRFERRQYVCLTVTEGRGSTQQCEGPLPLADRPLVAVMGDPTVCRPRPAQLIWGLALTNVSVALRSAGRERTAARRFIPAALHARGNLFFIWARSAPDSLIARNTTGRVEERYTINSGRVPVFATFCRHQPSTGAVALQSLPG